MRGLKVVLEINKSKTQMDAEIEACLALAKAYDTQDLRCPPHTRSNNTKARSATIVKGAPKRATSIRTAVRDKAK
jgi:hypothetical protein